MNLLCRISSMIAITCATSLGMLGQDAPEASTAPMVPVREQVAYLMSLSPVKPNKADAEYLRLYRNDPPAIRERLIKITNRAIAEASRHVPKVTVSSGDLWHAKAEEALAKSAGDKEMEERWGAIVRKWAEQSAKQSAYIVSMNRYAKPLAKLTGWIEGTATSDWEAGCTAIGATRAVRDATLLDEWTPEKEPEILKKVKARYSPQGE